MKFLSFPRTTVLSAMLSLASLGGSVGSCAMMQSDGDKQHYKVPEEQAHFCYRSLGRIECYTAPQPNMGEIVAYEAERVTEPPPAEKLDVSDDTKPMAPAAAATIPNKAPQTYTPTGPYTGPGPSKPIIHEAKSKPAVKKKASTKKPVTNCKPCSDGMKTFMEKPQTVAPIKEPVPVKEPVPAAAPSPAGADGAPTPLSNQAPAAP